MENNYKYFFRIIIPNYNNYNYLKRCLDSIVSQTFDNFICIIVDDMSTDKSIELINIYQKRYPKNVKLIQAAYKGYAGTARNIALKYDVISEYTWFVDSDDYLPDNNVLRRLHETILSNKFPDAIRCSYIDMKDSINKRHIVETNNIQSILKRGSAPWKTCHKSSIDAQFLSSSKFLEDDIYLYTLFDKIDPKRIAIETTPCYVYDRTSYTSNTNKPNIWLTKDGIDSIENAESFLKINKFKSLECNKHRNHIINHIIDVNFKPTISLDVFFGNSFIITIDKTRIKLEQDILSKVFDSRFPHIVNGGTNPAMPSWKNCMYSHLSIVKYAKRHNLPFVVIFEDDAYPCTDCEDILKTYLKYIPRDANLILLGWSRHAGKQSFNNIFNQVTSIISGAHSYIVFREAYDKYISYVASHSNAKADNEIFNNIGKAYILNKPLFIQYDTSLSMNNHKGYIYYGDHKTPPNGFEPIDYFDKRTQYVSFCNGNLGNQLYYVLQAYLKTDNNTNTIYSMRQRENDLGIYGIICKMGLGKYVSVGYQSPIFIKSYCQHIGKDFTIQQLNNFIKDTLIASNIFNIQNDNNKDEYQNTVALNIRNGDFLDEPIKSIHDCFDRTNYLSKVLEHESIKELNSVHVFSDDINLCKTLYDDILRKRFKTITYDTNGETVESQFIRLANYKHKIIWNSTFSIWASFIGDVIYNDDTIVICPSKFTKNEVMATRCKPSWIQIPV